MTVLQTKAEDHWNGGYTCIQPSSPGGGTGADPATDRLVVGGMVSHSQEDVEKLGSNWGEGLPASVSSCGCSLGTPG